MELEFPNLSDGAPQVRDEQLVEGRDKRRLIHSKRDLPRSVMVAHGEYEMSGDRVGSDDVDVLQPGSGGVTRDRRDGTVHAQGRGNHIPWWSGGEGPFGHSPRSPETAFRGTILCGRSSGLPSSEKGTTRNWTGRFGGSDPRGVWQRASADYARRRARGRILQDDPGESDQGFLPAGLEGHAL
jgi:hypothetical protein